MWKYFMCLFFHAVIYLTPQVCTSRVLGAAATNEMGFRNMKTVSRLPCYRNFQSRGIRYHKKRKSNGYRIGCICIYQYDSIGWWMSEQMKIKQEQKPLEYFERMLPSYDEYVREKYPESIELGNELSKQESKSTILQQNDGMYNIANDEVNKVQNPVSDNLTEVLMRRDFWSDFWMRHKDYRHPARVGCIHTLERSKNSVDRI